MATILRRSARFPSAAPSTPPSEISSDSQSDLLSLPPELRCMIWCEILVTQQRIMSIRPRTKVSGDLKYINGSWSTKSTEHGDMFIVLADLETPSKHGRVIDIAIFRTNSFIHSEATRVFYTMNQFILGDSPFICARRFTKYSHHIPLVHARYSDLVRNVHYINVNLLSLQIDLFEGTRMLMVWPNLRYLEIEVPSTYLHPTFDGLKEDLRAKVEKEQITNAAVYQVRYTLSLQQTRMPKNFEVRLVPAWDLAAEDVKDFEHLEAMVAEVVSRVQAAKPLRVL